MCRPGQPRRQGVPARAGCRLTWSEHSPCGDCFEGPNEPTERPLRVFESVDQDRALTGEAAARQLVTVGHGASIFGVQRKDLLDRRILIRAVVTSKSCKLDLDTPVRSVAEAQVADCTGVIIAARVILSSAILHAQLDHATIVARDGGGASDGPAASQLPPCPARADRAYHGQDKQRPEKAIQTFIGIAADYEDGNAADP